jgi:hypothetical protein
MEHERLAEAIEELNETMDVIRQILDEIREELQWGVRNNRVRIVTMAANPGADDMRLNQPPGQSAESLAASQREEIPVKQGQLF